MPLIRTAETCWLYKREPHPAVRVAGWLVVAWWHVGFMCVRYNWRYALSSPVFVWLSVLTCVFVMIIWTNSEMFLMLQAFDSGNPTMGSANFPHLSASAPHAGLHVELLLSSCCSGSCPWTKEHSTSLICTHVAFFSSSLVQRSVVPGNSALRTAYLHGLVWFSQWGNGLPVLYYWYCLKLYYLLY